MAKIKLGALAGQVSGSLGASTYSHNRYGTYIRQRTVPVGSSSEWAERAKGFLSAASSRYKDLTDGQIEGWRSLAAQVPVIDSLGDSRILAPNAAYVRCNANILWCGGTMKDDAPDDVPPSPVVLATPTLEVLTETASVAYTATPLAAGECLFLKAALMRSATRMYFLNRLKLIKITAAAAASPVDFWAELVERFGTPNVGDRLWIQAHVVLNTSGMWSSRGQTGGVFVAGTP